MNETPGVGWSAFGVRWVWGEGGCGCGCGCGCSAAWKNKCVIQDGFIEYKSKRKPHIGPAPRPFDRLSLLGLKLHGI